MTMKDGFKKKIVKMSGGDSSVNAKLLKRRVVEVLGEQVTYMSGDGT